jgi:hemerythrin
MRGIQWREKMSIDRGLVDEDHRHLINIINRFDHLVALGRFDRADVVEILHSLKFYTDTHFDREEHLQRLVGYPEHDSHHEEHGRLLKELDGIIAKASATDDGDAADVAPEMIKLLRHWLLGHIIGIDLRMRAYAEAMRRHTGGLPDLKDIPHERPAHA